MLVSSQKKNTPPPTDQNRVLKHSKRHQEESDKSKTRSAKPPKVETCENDLQVKGPEGTFLRLRSQRGCIARRHQRFPQGRGILDSKMGIKLVRWRANMLTRC